jgi:DNA-directed RNA polymerase subunit K/omega
MSDNEDNDESYSHNSEDDDEEEEEDTPYVIKPNVVKSLVDVKGDIVDDDEDEYPDEDDDPEEDDEEDADEDEENEVKGGGKTAAVDAPVKYASDDDASDDDASDDDDAYDDNYLQKFDSEITKNYINEFHPECLHHNYDEIAQMSLVTRDNHNIIIDPFHRTIPTLTKYEKARVLGQRASQIESGAQPLVAVPVHIVEGYLIAELELKQKRIPFIIRRPIPGGGCEYWNIKDLEDISF